MKIKISWLSAICNVALLICVLVLLLTEASPIHRTPSQVLFIALMIATPLLSLVCIWQGAQPTENGQSWIALEIEARKAKLRRRIQEYNDTTKTG